jgi:hypothetical protein
MGVYMTFASQKNELGIFISTENGDVTGIEVSARPRPNAMASMAPSTGQARNGIYGQQ